MEGCMSAMLGNEPVELSRGLQQLKSEHPPLRDNMNELLRLCQTLEDQSEKQKLFSQLINDVNIFFQKLEMHSLKEENVLFPMMEKYLGKGQGPVAVMEYEHEQAKGLIGSFLKNSAATLTEGNLVSQSKKVSDACDLLINHFAKEEAVLFPMAEKLFTDAEKKELYEKIQ